MPKPSAATTSLVAAHVGSLARHVSEPLAHLMVVGREICGEDADTFLVLLVIIQQANRHADYAKLDPERVARGEVAEIPSLDMNVQSIAGYTGIPKETVRRKVMGLVDQGWVARDGSTLRFTPEGYRAMTPVRKAAIALAAEIVDAVDRFR